MGRWSKKDYEMVAEHLQGSGLTIPVNVALNFADTFGNDSEKFNRALFLRACGVTE